MWDLNNRIGTYSVEIGMDNVFHSKVFNIPVGSSFACSSTRGLFCQTVILPQSLCYWLLLGPHPALQGHFITVFKEGYLNKTNRTTATFLFVKVYTTSFLPLIFLF